MRKRPSLIRSSLILTGLVLVILTVPILYTQLFPQPGRALHGVRLEQGEYQTVSFSNPAQHIELAGLLFLPDRAPPYPAVVVIHGSGTSRRGNGWYLTFVADLQSRGIAVLLPDKRGSESSGGDWRTASFEDLATDTESAVTYLRQAFPSRFSHIGLLGASQGGMIAPIVASRNDDVDFVINMVGASVPLHDALIYEENNNLREMGLLPGFSHLVSHLSTFYIRQVAQKEFWQRVGNFDPLPYWQAVTVPVLTLYGGGDTNVPSQASAARFEALQKSNLEVIVFPGSGHALEEPEHVGDRVFRPDAANAIATFIDTVTMAE